MERPSAPATCAVVLEGDPAYCARFGFDAAEGLVVLRPDAF
jgi:predicted N-acetyltransferase YhbS